MKDTVTLWVAGVPAPQGSKDGFSPKGTNKVRMVESSKRVKPWRETVARCSEGLVPEPIVDPVNVFVIFVFAREKTVRRFWPTGRGHGDIDKLLRSTYDALVMGGVLKDDALIVGGGQLKRYVSNPYETPGAYIWIEKEKQWETGHVKTASARA